MFIIDPAEFPDKDAASLISFLKRCQEIAIQKNHTQLVSISQTIGAIDPLLVLKSIHESNDLHFYYEKPELGIALAASETALSKTFQGSQRFSESKAFAEETLQNTIAFGDLYKPFTGPHFFSAFTFFDSHEERHESSFEPATLFIPRWQVAKSGESYTAVVNVLIEANTPIEALALRIFSAYKKLHIHDYSSQQAQSPAPLAQDAFTQINVGGENYFEEAVLKATECIQAGKYKKIVLARAIDLKGAHSFHPLESAARLRLSYPSCHILSFGNGFKKTFIAATPEELLKLDNGILSTEALAGSIPRGKTPSDDETLGQELLNSQKDLAEHTFVVDSIISNLQKINISIPKENKPPALLKLPNIQHLHTPLTVKIPSELHILDIAQTLHPTPAVGGTPIEKARQGIQSIENFDRGLYAGAIGWFDYKNNGQLLVGIRCALIEEDKARLFAGAGIIQGSNPAKEKAETTLKLQALLSNI